MLIIYIITYSIYILYQSSEFVKRDNRQTAEPGCYTEQPWP